MDAAAAAAAPAPAPAPASAPVPVPAPGHAPAPVPAHDLEEALTVPAAARLLQLESLLSRSQENVERLLQVAYDV